MENTIKCTCEWADDVGDPEVGPDPYIAEVDRDCPEHGVKVIWINAYSVDRCYGGPEEGGWYYNWYRCLASMPILRDDDSDRERLVNQWMKDAIGWSPSEYESRHGGARYTVNGRDDFIVLTEDERAQSQSTERPHYE